MVTEPLQEVIFVGIPGPTHHYSGLSPDNVASNLNRGTVSNPRQAALQALDLIRLLQSLGVIAAVLPPQLRPHMPLLRQHFSGSDEEVIKQAAFSAPVLLAQAASTSSMWTANAATVSPVTDCADGKLHITTANLFTNLHRRIEAEDTYRVLQAIFAGAPDCVVHYPLSAAAGACDEGAANHMRFSPNASAQGLEVFVYGADGSARDPESARQTLSASKALQRQHHIPENAALFMRQNPIVIDEGVFHNDVIAVSHENLLLVHERAYDNGRYDIARISEAYSALHPGHELRVIGIEEDDLSLEEAVHTYLFNSQIVTRPDGGMALIAPIETGLLYEGKAARLLERIRDDTSNPIDAIYPIDLRQSMRNGGGPACLRLRVPMTSAQLAAVSSSVRVVADDIMLAALEKIIRTYYPEQLMPQDLGDISHYYKCREALAAFSDVMRLPLLG